MKFIHIADTHLGAEPEGLKLGSESRAKELWDALEQIVNICEWEEMDLLLIAGDLFHRQPLLRELKEESTNKHDIILLKSKIFFFIEAIPPLSVLLLYTHFHCLSTLF